MPRKKREFSAKVEAQISAMATAGGTAQAISKALRAAGVKGASPATVGRRLRELRRGVTTPRAGSRAELRAAYASPEQTDSPLPETPEAIPEGTALSQIERWLKRAEAMGKIAVEKGDLAGMGQMGRLTSALLEAKRKATPPDKDDPKDNPDMGAAAARARATLHKYIDQALGKPTGGT